MIRKTSITIIGSKDVLYELYENVKQYIYKPLGKKCAYSGRGNLHVILDEDSPGFLYLLEMSKTLNLHPHITQWVGYTKSEKENADFYEMSIPSPLELEGTDAGDYGTQYIGGCPHCGLGRKPVSDVLVDRKFIKKYHIGSLYPEIFVSEFVKELICSNDLSGTLFKHEVKDYKGREMSKYFCIEISNILPLMSSTAWLIQEDSHRYKDCGDNVIYLRSDCQYERKKLANAQDFNLTYEYIDNFRERKIIVSEKVRKLFQSNKLYVAFTPVAII